MLTYSIHERGKESKTVYLYKQIRKDILLGNLRPFERLPSKRDLSEHLGISQMTVENAYGLLEEEGYIFSKPRSGFYVSELHPINYQKDLPYPRDLLQDDNPQPANIQRVTGLSRIIRRILSQNPDILFYKAPHLGCAALRNAISDFLFRFRGMIVQPKNIIIGSGSEYLYGILVQLLGPGLSVAIEYPSYEKIELVYRANDAKVERLQMGEDGILSSELSGVKASFLHVSPFHSFPSGITAPISKRLEYLAWAERNHAYILEDDFDSELSFFRKPIETLYSLDHLGCVIYMNTFSKSISSGIRIAYMVLPDSLMDRYAEKLSFYSCTVPVFDQYVLAEFIDGGGFERHLGRIRKNAYVSGRKKKK